MRTVANHTERERTIAKMIEKNCPHCGAAMPEEAHYCLQCMTPCTPAQPSTAYLKSCAEHSQKRINRKQISSVLAAMILLVVLIPSVLAAPLLQQNTVTAEGALTGTVQAAETETEAQPKTLLGKVKKAAKKAEQKIQSATGKMKEAVGIAPTAEEKQAMPTRPRSRPPNRRKETTAPLATGVIPATQTIRGTAVQATATGTAPPAPRPRPQTAPPSPAAPPQRPPRNRPPSRKTQPCPSRNITNTSTPWTATMPR